MDERELIELITREVLKTIQAKGLDLTPQKSLPLVVLSGDSPEAIGTLEKSSREFRLFIDGSVTASRLPAALQSRLCHGTTEAEIAEILETSSLIYLPALPLAVLSRFVNLQPECSVSLLLTKALLKKLPVKAQKIFTNPEINLYDTHEPSPILRRVQGLVSESTQMGIEWTRFGELEKILAPLAPKVQKGSKRLLTAAEVKSMKDKGAITVQKGTIITPLAKDEIKRYRLKVILTD